jgi:hypothetical protein
MTMPARQRAASLSFTESELRLLFTEVNSAIDCGAEDPDYVKIRDKARRALRKFNVADDCSNEKVRSGHV